MTLRLVALSTLLFAAACGDDGTFIDAAPQPVDSATIDSTSPFDAVPPDADTTVPDAMSLDAMSLDAMSPDAMPPDAMPPDAMSPDAMSPDAMPPSVGVVWFHGDWVADGLQKAGRVAADATFPVDSSTLPVVPGTQVSVDELASGSAYSTVFDVNADGSRIAYVADSTTATRYDLFSANADGSSPVTVFEAPASVEIGAIAISPDGSKIAFMADLAGTDGMQDIYVVPNQANATPVRVSPDRAAANAALDAFRVVTWSADSRYLAFSGDFTEDGYDEVYVRDTMTSTTAAVLPRADILMPSTTMGAKGVRGAALFDAMNRVYFRARVQNSATPPFELFRASADGTGRATLTTPQRADTSASEPGAFAISPDGMAIAFSADAPTATAYELYYAPVGDLTAPVRLTSGSVRAGGNAEFTTPMWFSPDGTRIAFAADFETEGEFEPYVATVASAGSAIRLVSLTITSTDVDGMAWAQDGSVVFCRADLAVNNDTSVFALSPSTVDQTPTLAVGVPTGGDVFDLKSSPAP